MDMYGLQEDLNSLGRMPTTQVSLKNNRTTVGPSGVANDSANRYDGVCIWGEYSRRRLTDKAVRVVKLKARSGEEVYPNSPLASNTPS